jgi:hypothetical protein
MVLYLWFFDQIVGAKLLVHFSVAKILRAGRNFYVSSNLVVGFGLASYTDLSAEGPIRGASVRGL